MSARYVAQAADRCGVFYESAESADLRRAIDAAIAVRTRWGKDVIVSVLNLDNIDVGCPDGLTWGERDEVHAAFMVARRAS